MDAEEHDPPQPSRKIALKENPGKSIYAGVRESRRSATALAKELGHQQNTS